MADYELKTTTIDEIKERLIVAIEMLQETNLPVETTSTIVFALSVTYRLAQDAPEFLSELSQRIAAVQAHIIGNKTQS